MNDTPPEKLLSNLLADSFTTDELRRFLEIFYPDTASKLPNASLSGIAHEAVMALKRSKLIDEMLIRRLEEHFPKRQADIYTCARSRGLKLTFLSGSGPSGFTVSPVRIKAVNSPSKASSPRTVMFSSGQFTYTPNVWNGSSGASSPREEGRVDADARKKSAVAVFEQGTPSPESCAALESVYRDNGALADLLTLYRQCLDDSKYDPRGGDARPHRHVVGVGAQRHARDDRELLARVVPSRRDRGEQQIVGDRRDHNRTELDAKSVSFNDRLTRLSGA